MEPVSTPRALEVGKRYDIALKQVQQGKVPDLSLLEPAERGMVAAYAARWAGQIEIERVDVPFRVRIGSVDVVGEIDAIGVWRNPAVGIGAVGRRVLLETKTTSEDISPGSGYWRRVCGVDPQSTIYLRAARDLGLAEPFLVWDAILKPLLRQKQNETDDQFSARVLESVSDDYPRYFQRAEIVRHEPEHEAAERDLQGVVHLMEVTRMQLKEAPRNPDACMKWGRECCFLPVCSGSDSLANPLRYKKRERPVKKGPVEEAPGKPRLEW